MVHQPLEAAEAVCVCVCVCVRGVVVDGVWGVCVHAHKHHFKPSECSLESTTHECAVPSQCTVMATAVMATSLAFVSD